jgi:hypothetical protein
MTTTPKPGTAAWRRWQQAIDETDMQRGGPGCNARPNVDPHRHRHPHLRDRCPQSKYQTHRMIVMRAGGQEFVACEFCHQTSAQIRARLRG